MGANFPSGIFLYVSNACLRINVANPNPNRIAAATASYSRGGMLEFVLSMELRDCITGYTLLSWMHMICNHSPLRRNKNNLFYPFYANQRIQIQHILVTTLWIQNIYIHSCASCAANCAGLYWFHRLGRNTPLGKWRCAAVAIGSKNYSLNIVYDFSCFC